MNSYKTVRKKASSNIFILQGIIQVGRFYNFYEL